MSSELSARGVDCTAVTLGEAGAPIFLFTCDCGTETAVAVEDLTRDSGKDVLEFAFTCSGCESSHWVTIARDREVPGEH